MFSMVSPELLASLHLQSQFMNGHLLQHRGFPLPHLPPPNGFPSELVKHFQQQQQQRAEQALSRAASAASSPHLKDTKPLITSARHDTPSMTPDIKSELASSAAAGCVAKVLDTAEVALKIREVLSANNIGQRLFAKHVLGLSQGTVSELLSKPKHWDKLTEKGRESYRKMHSWASNPHLVEGLKAISPKKGESLENECEY